MVLFCFFLLNSNIWTFEHIIPLDIYKKHSPIPLIVRALKRRKNKRMQEPTQDAIIGAMFVHKGPPSALESATRGI